MSMSEEKLMQIAYGLEQFLIAWPKIPWDETPPEVQEFNVDPKEHGGPIGIGKHPEFGWFVLGCGQGPFIIWIGVDLKMLETKFVDFRPLGGSTPGREDTRESGLDLAN